MADTDDLGQQIAGALTGSQRTAAAAESLTGGQVSAALSAIEGASGWFAGGVVAYAADVKFDLLGVERGPEVVEQATRQALHDLAAAVVGAGIIDAQLSKA